MLALILLSVSVRDLWGQAASASSKTALRADAAQTASTGEHDGMELNSVVAVVNQRVILASDVDMELRIIHLLPAGNRKENSAADALERLTTRALIEQQMLLEDPTELNTPEAEVTKSLIELRQNLPACTLTDCMTEAGWKNFLSGLDLTPERVFAYWKERIAVLAFIELRFRSGLQIAPEEIESYYTKTLLPQYSHPSDAPSLKSVSPRIQEILLQERVNGLLDEWLKSLKDEGQVEVLDPRLRVAVEKSEAAKSTVGSASSVEMKLTHGDGRRSRRDDGQGQKSGQAGTGGNQQ
uniref:Peptidylprolyl isomerase n=1 Tax=mine drainage metagenome TaxID=410659 RepID=E6PZM8_9ZZZZ